MPCFICQHCCPCADCWSPQWQKGQIEYQIFTMENTYTIIVDLIEFAKARNCGHTNTSMHTHTHTHTDTHTQTAVSDMHPFMPELYSVPSAFLCISLSLSHFLDTHMHTHT